MERPTNFRYTREHEWLDADGRVGITDYAQAALGDVVFVELPDVGRSFRQGEAFGVVESVKSVADLYFPVDGTVVAVNTALTTQPELVNQDPFGQGWMIQITIQGNERHLLDASAYATLVQE